MLRACKSQVRPAQATVAKEIGELLPLDAAGYAVIDLDATLTGVGANG